MEVIVNYKQNETVKTIRFSTNFFTCDYTNEDKLIEYLMYIENNDVDELTIVETVFVSELILAL